jgi:hypothetical protein
MSKTKKNGDIASVSDFTLDDIVNMVDYGFWYATESQNNGSVPIGNILQKLMSDKKLLKVPKEWRKYQEENRDDR